MKKEIFETIKIEPFNTDILFYYSKTPEENLHRHLNNKKNKHISDWLKKSFDKITLGDGLGGVCRDIESKKPYIIYIKNTGKKDWLLYETIVHETNHLVDDLSIFFCFETEQEFKAYLQEYLFRKIRKIIHK